MIHCVSVDRFKFYREDDILNVHVPGESVGPRKNENFPATYTFSDILSVFILSSKPAI